MAERAEISWGVSRIVWRSIVLIVVSHLSNLRSLGRLKRGVVEGAFTIFLSYPQVASLLQLPEAGDHSRSD